MNRGTGGYRGRANGVGGESKTGGGDGPRAGGPSKDERPRTSVADDERERSRAREAEMRGSPDEDRRYRYDPGPIDDAGERRGGIASPYEDEPAVVRGGSEWRNERPPTYESSSGEGYGRGEPPRAGEARVDVGERAGREGWHRVSDYVRRGRAWPEQVRAGRERGAFTRGATGGYEGRPGEHDPSWRGRDEDHDFWGRDRHARRGIGERIGEFLGTRPSDASIPPPPERLERGGPQPRRVPHYSEAGLWNRVKGVFTGKGPKNYVRSDERIREDVCEQLCYHPYVDASDVEVMVTNGEVTLTGTVDDRDAKRLAEDVAVDVRGVVDVHNQLRLKPEGPRGGYAPRR